jgi:hypothetical protein
MAAVHIVDEKQSAGSAEYRVRLHGQTQFYDFKFRLEVVPKKNSKK